MTLPRPERRGEQHVARLDVGLHLGEAGVGQGLSQLGHGYFRLPTLTARRNAMKVGTARA